MHWEKFIYKQITGDFNKYLYGYNIIKLAHAFSDL